MIEEIHNIPRLQFRFDSTVPKDMNKPESDVTTNKRGLFYSKPTLPSLPNFCNNFSEWKNQLNSVNTSFRTPLPKFIFQTFANYVKLFFMDN